MVAAESNYQYIMKFSKDRLLGNRVRIRNRYYRIKVRVGRVGSGKVSLEI